MGLEQFRLSLGVFFGRWIWFSSGFLPFAPKYAIMVAGMVGLAQMVRASDCGPEGRRFNSDIPPQVIASVVQRLVYKFSKLGMRVRFSPLAPTK